MSDQFDDDAVYQIICKLDDLCLDGKFAEVDAFFESVDVDSYTDSAVLFSILNYAWMIEKNGDPTRVGQDIRKKIRTRLVTLIGEERTAYLLKHRGG